MTQREWWSIRERLVRALTAGVVLRAERFSGLAVTVGPRFDAAAPRSRRSEAVAARRARRGDAPAGFAVWTDGSRSGGRRSDFDDANAAAGRFLLLVGHAAALWALRLRPTRGNPLPLPDPADGFDGEMLTDLVALLLRGAPLGLGVDGHFVCALPDAGSGASLEIDEQRVAVGDAFDVAAHFYAIIGVRDARRALRSARRDLEALRAEGADDDEEGADAAA